MSIKTFTVSAIALAAIAFAANTQAADGTGDASATVIAPIAITPVNALSFGKFVSGAGTVVVTTAGDRSSPDVVLSTAGDFVSAGTFTVTGEADATFSIAVDPTATLTGASTDSMVATLFADLTGTTATSTAAPALTGGTLTAGTQTIYVGGELAVLGTETAEDYSGTYTVSVNYN